MMKIGGNKYGIQILCDRIILDKCEVNRNSVVNIVEVSFSDIEKNSCNHVADDRLNIDSISENEYTTCSMCNGSGISSIDLSDCRICHGSGKIIVR